MNVELHRTQRVFISTLQNERRWWLSDMENARASSGRLFLRGTWYDNAELAKPFTYEIATVARRRFNEQGINTEISLECGDKAAFLEE